MSAFHIELAGAPGSGKSTRSEAMGGRRLPSTSGRGKRLWPIEDVVAATSLPLVGLVRWPASLRGATSEGWDRTEERFGDLLHRLASREVEGPRGEPEPRARSMEWFRRDLQMLLVAEARLIGRPQRILPLMHEGLVQRSVSVLGNRATASARADLVMRTFPPLAVVHLRCDEAELERRALERRRSGTEPQLHRSLETERMIGQVLEDARAIATTLDLLAGVGVPVIESDSTDERDIAGVTDRLLERLAVVLRGD